MQVVILAAGPGTRMRPAVVDTPKALLRVNGETLLERLLRQVAEYPDVERMLVVAGHAADRMAAAARASGHPVEVVFNRAFARDDNLQSMQVALERIDPRRPVLALESSLWLEDGAVRVIVEAAREARSTWFTAGSFDPGMRSDVLQHDACGRVESILLEATWRPELASYRRLLGAVAIAPGQIEVFREAVAGALQAGARRYETVLEFDRRLLAARCVDLQDHRTTSVRTVAEYAALCEELDRDRRSSGAGVSLVPLSWLRPFEAARPERVSEVGERMDAEAIWHRALVADRQHFVVLDGIHRLAAARQRGLQQVPVVLVDYDRIPVWALTAGERITREQVLSRALAGDPFPPRRVKHQLPILPLDCRYLITGLAA